MPSHILSIADTQLLLDGQPFLLQGLSFFNAAYNPAFNRTSAERIAWLRRFQQYGINMLRVWCQWDFVDRTFVDLATHHTMYTAAGAVQVEPFERLAALIEEMDALGMVVEVVLFSHEKKPYYPPEVLERGAHNMAELLLPYRNLILQIWNEDSTAVARCYHAAKQVDPARIVTNAPGFANVLGDDAQNEMLDLLTPHTVRREAAHFWEIAPQQVAALLARFGKPVIDDEPARCGTTQYGGIPGGAQPWQHIEQIKQVRAVGGYHVYHHDMFQMGYGHPSIPPHGIPDPEFPFHREVFAFLRDNRVW